MEEEEEEEEEVGGAKEEGGGKREKRGEGGKISELFAACWRCALPCSTRDGLRGTTVSEQPFRQGGEAMAHCGEDSPRYEAGQKWLP